MIFASALAWPEFDSMVIANVRRIGSAFALWGAGVREPPEKACENAAS